MNIAWCIAKSIYRGRQFDRFLDKYKNEHSLQELQFYFGVVLAISDNLNNSIIVSTMKYKGVKRQRTKEWLQIIV